MKRFLKKYHKHLRKLAALAVVLSVTMVAAFAEEATGGSLDMSAINTSLSSGLNNVVTQAISLLSLMLPFALSFFGVKWLCVKATGWFKSMAK